MTEDELACTYDALARSRPRDADRLRAHADHAREYAQVERDRATQYRVDPA